MSPWAQLGHNSHTTTALAMTRAIAFQKVYSGFAHANRLHKRCLQACKHFSGTAELKSGRPSDNCGSQGPNVGAAARPSLTPPPPMAGPAVARVIRGTRKFDRGLTMWRRNLRSATRGLLNFHWYNMTSYGRRAFSYAGPHAWNSLPEHWRQTTSIELFKRSLKPFLFGQIAC